MKRTNMNSTRAAQPANIKASTGARTSMTRVAATTSIGLEPLRILIVEDEPLIGMLLGEMIEIMGHEVCAIEVTEAGAVSAAARCEPNLLIVDAQLREGSGISAVDTILARTFIPHVFVSGNRRGVLMVRPKSIVIEKPFTEAALADGIARARGMR